MVASCCRPGLVCLSLLCASCSLIVDTGGPGGSDVDGDGGVSLTPNCVERAFLHVPELSDLPPSQGPVVLPGGESVFDTETRTLVDDEAALQIDDIPLVRIGEEMVAVLVVDSLGSDANAGLRLTGPHPAAIVSLTTIALEGPVDASSSVDGPSGAGANPAVCFATNGFGEGNDGTGVTPGGGGGGGGLGSRGGQGGSSGAATGGAGGSPLTEEPPVLHGGCPGGDGAGLGGGAGGSGGGAVYLAACTSISLGGAVNVGGAGGLAGSATAGGGGGGSGGYFAVDSPVLMVTADLAANGGGGGSNNALNGEDGKFGDDAASGGSGPDAPGGDGDTQNNQVGAGASGDGVASGGGGGGGGVGQIVIRSLAPPESAVFSPAPQIVEER